jgi:hypothetical protein
MQNLKPPTYSTMKCAPSQASRFDRIGDTPLAFPEIVRVAWGVWTDALTTEEWIRATIEIVVAQPITSAR